MLKKAIIASFLVFMLLLQPVAVSALTESEAKQAWRDAKRISQEKQQLYRDAQIQYAGNKSAENNQKVIDTGKEALHAALNEAEAWLKWKDIEAQGNPDIPADLKATISADVATNLAKIDELRKDVDKISNQVELGIVFLKMVGKYLELLTDVARDYGKILVSIGNTYIAKAEDYESKLRAEAIKINNNTAILEKLDRAKADLNEARSNVNKAKASYEQVVLPGTPLIKFTEGNNYLRVARTNLLSAHSNLNQAYNLMLRGG